MYLLFTIAKTLKQPKCTLTEEWTKKMWEKKKMWYICTMGYYSAIKKNEIMAFAVLWMDLDTILSEGSQIKWSKSDKDIYHETSLIHEI